MPTMGGGDIGITAIVITAPFTLAIGGSVVIPLGRAIVAIRTPDADFDDLKLQISRNAGVNWDNIIGPSNLLVGALTPDMLVLADIWQLTTALLISDGVNLRIQAPLAQVVDIQYAYVDVG